MKAFYIILILLSVFGVLMFCPVVLKISYNEELKVRLRYLFIFKTLYPVKEKPKKSKNNKPKEDNINASKKDKKDSKLKDKIKNDGISGFAEAISESLKKLSKLPVFVKKHLIVSLLQIKFSVSSDNAADTAVNYGKICALVYPAVSLTASNLKCKKIDTEIYPDFDKTENDININIFMKIKLIFLLIAVIKGIITGVSIVKLFSEDTTNDDFKHKETIKKETAEI